MKIPVFLNNLQHFCPFYFLLDDFLEVFSFWRRLWDARNASLYSSSAVVGLPWPAAQHPHSCWLTPTPSAVGRTRARVRRSVGWDQTVLGREGDLRQSPQPTGRSMLSFQTATLEDNLLPSPAFLLFFFLLTDIVGSGISPWLVLVSSPCCVLLEENTPLSSLSGTCSHILT